MVFWKREWTTWSLMQFSLNCSSWHLPITFVMGSSAPWDHSALLTAVGEPVLCFGCVSQSLVISVSQTRRLWFVGALSQPARAAVIIYGAHCHKTPKYRQSFPCNICNPQEISRGQDAVGKAGKGTGKRERMVQPLGWLLSTQESRIQFPNLPQPSSITMVPYNLGNVESFKRLIHNTILSHFLWAFWKEWVDE